MRRTLACFIPIYRKFCDVILLLLLLCLDLCSEQIFLLAALLLLWSFLAAWSIKTDLFFGTWWRWHWPEHKMLLHHFYLFFFFFVSLVDKHIFYFSSLSKKLSFLHRKLIFSRSSGKSYCNVLSSNPITQRCTDSTQMSYSNFSVTSLCRKKHSDWMFQVTSLFWTNQTVLFLYCVSIKC